MWPRSRAINVYLAEAVLSLSHTRHTGMASSAPHGNESWISKPSDTSFLPIGQMVQTTTNPILGNINSCAIVQPRANSPAPRANATSQVLTGSSLLTSTEPVSSPPLYLSEPLFGSIPSTVLGGLVRSSNPPTPSDDVVRFLENPGPVLLDLPDSTYNTALHAPCGSWCLQTHGRTNPLQGVLHG